MSAGWRAALDNARWSYPLDPNCRDVRRAASMRLHVNEAMHRAECRCCSGYSQLHAKLESDYSREPEVRVNTRGTRL